MERDKMDLRATNENYRFTNRQSSLQPATENKMQAITLPRSAPGKPCPLGEHAEVHAAEAIASAINHLHHRDSHRSEPDRLGEKQWKQ